MYLHLPKLSQRFRSCLASDTEFPLNSIGQKLYWMGLKVSDFTSTKLPAGVIVMSNKVGRFPPVYFSSSYLWWLQKHIGFTETKTKTTTYIRSIRSSLIFRSVPFDSHTVNKIAWGWCQQVEFPLPFPLKLSRRQKEHFHLLSQISALEEGLYFQL